MIVYVGKVGRADFDAAKLIAIFERRIESRLVLDHRPAHRSGVLFAAEGWRSHKS